MTEFLQLLVVGLSTGSAFALVGMSLVLVYRTTGIVNFAQGVFAVIGGLFTFQLSDEMPLALAMYVETNPVPLKYMLSVLGKCSAEVRLPLCEASDASKAMVRKALESTGLLAGRREAALQPA